MLLAENVAPLASFPNLNNLRVERHRFDDTFPEKAPSSQGAPSDFSKLQQKQNQKIVWSRPLLPILQFSWPWYTQSKSFDSSLMISRIISRISRTTNWFWNWWLVSSQRRSVAVNGGYLGAIFEVKEEIGSKGANLCSGSIFILYTLYFDGGATFSEFQLSGLANHRLRPDPTFLPCYNIIILTECSQGHGLAFLVLYGQPDPISKFSLQLYLCFVITPTRICVNLLLAVSVPSRKLFGCWIYAMRDWQIQRFSKTWTHNSWILAPTAP